MRVVNIALRASGPKYEQYPSLVEVGLNKEEWRAFYGDIIDKASNATMEEAAEEL